jgi:hypothetical protein
MQRADMPSASRLKDTPIAFHFPQLSIQLFLLLDHLPNKRIVVRQQFRKIHGLLGLQNKAIGKFAVGILK